MEVFQNGGTHKSSMLFSEFPKNKPSSYWPPRLTEVLHDLGDDLGDLLMINHRFQVGFRNHPQYFSGDLHLKSLEVLHGFSAFHRGPGGLVSARWRAWAGDGRCKTFDASADGFGRSEGSGAVPRAQRPGECQVLKAINLGIFMGKSWIRTITGCVVSNIFYFP